MKYYVGLLVVASFMSSMLAEVDPKPASKISQPEKVKTLEKAAFLRKRQSIVAVHKRNRRVYRLRGYSAVLV